MTGRWDIRSHSGGGRGRRTPERLELLRKATREVVREQPELKNQRGRLHSAVFARMKRDGYFHWHEGFVKLPAKGQPYIKKGLWNEKEFFYKRNYFWAKADIARFAKEIHVDGTSPWMKIALVAIGVLILRKLLK